jgi:hypothetical protein
LAAVIQQDSSRIQRDAGYIRMQKRDIPRKSEMKQVAGYIRIRDILV